MKKILILLSFAIISVQALATTYYVKNGGNDGNTGLSDAQAWKTISKINSHAFSPGDSILFKKGDIWRETLIVPSSGTADKYITFSSYGTSSDKPKIYGSVKATTWTDQGNNVWKSAITFTNPYTPTDFEAEVFFVRADATAAWGVHKPDAASLAAEYDWTWSANSIYVYSTSNPDTQYSSVEVPQREKTINVRLKEYITIDGLDLQFAKSRTIEADELPNGTGFTLKNCHLSYVGSRFSFPSYSGSRGYHVAVVRNNFLVQNNNISEGGRRLISFHLYDYDGLTFSNIAVEGNTLYGCYHGGIGIAMDGPRSNNRFENIIIRNNVLSDDPARNPSVDGFDPTQQCGIRAGEWGSSIENVEVYNNVFKYPTGLSLELLNVDNAKIYNNTFFDFNHTPSAYGLFQLDISHGCTAIDIKNNIFYGTVMKTSSSYVCNNLYIEADQPVTDLTVDYNLFYQKDPSQGIVNKWGTMYRTTGDKPWSAVKTDLGYQLNDPGLLDPDFISMPDNLHLSSSSPAIGKGINVGLSTDHDGNAWNAPPSIGAFEYNSSPIAFAITAPNGGEAWTVGSSHNITWTAPSSITNVKLEYSINSGSTWTQILASTPNDGTQAWTIPNAPATTCLVRISDAANAATFDTSNAVFAISAVETVSAPTQPSGQATGTKGVSYSYSTGGSTSSLGHSVQYKFDWNDGSTSGWLAVGTTTASHSWAATGTYNVRAMARCASNTAIESIWSETHALVILATGKASCDFNGDGRSDIAVWRPSSGCWFIQGQGIYRWGANGDVPVCGDYNGDGKTDIAVWRPGSGCWFIQGQGIYQWGTNGDVPVCGDYNGDGKTDIAVWRSSSGCWFIQGQGIYRWGTNGDVPVCGDYNGDGQTDIAVWRPADGNWYIMGQGVYKWGVSGDVPVCGDYNGDGQTDIAVWRPADGNWYIMGQGVYKWGTNGDVPVCGDYNGDGKTDITVWRPSNGYWYIMGQGAYQWGTRGDTPLD